MWGFPRVRVFHNVRKDLTSSYSIIRYIFAGLCIVYPPRNEKKHVFHEKVEPPVIRRLVCFKEEEGFYSPSARKSAGFMGSS